MHQVQKIGPQFVVQSFVLDIKFRILDHDFWSILMNLTSSSEYWTTIYGPFLWTCLNEHQRAKIVFYVLNELAVKCIGLDHNSWSIVMNLTSSSEYWTTICGPFLWTCLNEHRRAKIVFYVLNELAVKYIGLDHNSWSIVMNLTSSSEYWTTICGPFLWTWVNEYLIYNVTWK